MNLEEKSTKELLELHNALADLPAGPKTFATKAKLLARICSLAESKGIDLASYALLGAQADTTRSDDVQVTPHGAEEATEPKEPKKRGLVLLC